MTSYSFFSASSLTAKAAEDIVIPPFQVAFVATNVILPDADDTCHVVHRYWRDADGGSLFRAPSQWAPRMYTDVYPGSCLKQLDVRVFGPITIHKGQELGSLFLEETLCPDPDQQPVAIPAQSSAAVWTTRGPEPSPILTKSQLNSGAFVYKTDCWALSATAGACDLLIEPHQFVFGISKYWDTKRFQSGLYELCHD